jgi:uncharacterized membrane protein
MAANQRENMRTRSDRIRHAIGFEVIGLILCAPLASWVFDLDVVHMGILGVAISFVATGWNYLYNVMFDKLMLKWRGRLQKNYRERVVHAVSFELGLLMLTLPMVAGYLSISLWQAFIVDIGLVVFYVIYAFFYNLAYDRIFPVPAVRPD